jgi:hypothetical protein
MKKFKQIGGAQKEWDPEKGKYVKKVKKEKEKKWVHKNNYIKTRYGLIKGENTPYIKPKEKENGENK